MPTLHFHHKGEKASEVVGVDVKKLEAAMHGKSTQAATTTMRSTIAASQGQPAGRRATTLKADFI